LFVLALFAKCFCIVPAQAQSHEMALKTLSQQALQEKVYVHTDRHLYTAGQTLWYSVFLVRGPEHQPDTLNGTAYFDLYLPTGRLGYRQIIPLQNGLGRGSLDLPDTLSSGTYFYRAYTRFMLNYDTAYIPKGNIRVLNPTQDPYQVSVQYQAAGKNTLKVSLGIVNQFGRKEANKQFNLKLKGPEFDQEKRSTVFTDSLGRASTLFKVNQRWRPATLQVVYQNAFERNIVKVFQVPEVYLNGATNKAPASTTTQAATSVQAGRPWVTVLPEGGHAPATKTWTYAFHTQTPGKAPGSLTLRLLSKATDSLLYTIKTDSFGLGTATLPPQPAQGWYLQTSYAGSTYIYEMPAVKKTGYFLSLTPVQAAWQMQVHVAGSNLTDSLWVAVHARGRARTLLRLLNNQGSITGTVPAKGLPHGVLQFTLINKQGLPLATRAVFNHHTPMGYPVNLNLSQQNIGLRQPIQASPASNLPAGNYVFSVSNTAQSATVPKPDLYTTLWLGSELPGPLPPGYSLQKALQTKQGLQQLNALLLTHAYVRYAWPQKVQKEAKPNVYPIEVQRTLSGTIYKSYGSEKPLTKARVSLFIPSKLMLKMDSTDQQGRYSFTGLDYTTPAMVRVEGRRPKGGQRMHLTLDPLLERAPMPLPHELSAVRQFETLQDQWQQGRAYQSVQRAFDTTGSIVLNEVIIQASPASMLDSLYYRPFKEPDLFLDLNNLPLSFKGSLASYLSTFPQVRLISGFPALPNGQLEDPRKRYPDAPRMGINGVIQPLDQTYAVFQTISISNVRYVEIVESRKARRVYGPEFNGGVIIFYLREPYDRANGNFDGRQNRLVFELPGYSICKTFYVPDYGPANDPEKPDLRPTLFWQAFNHPGGPIDPWRFYSGDLSGRYQLYLEGISQQGQPVKAQSFINIGPRF